MAVVGSGRALMIRSERPLLVAIVFAAVEWRPLLLEVPGSLPRAACVKVVLQHDQTVQKLTIPRPPHRRKLQYSSIFFFTAGEYTE